MAGPEEDTDKSHEPTQHKLDEARKKGELVRSADFNTAASYIGFLIAGLAGGVYSVQQIGNVFHVLLEQPDRLAPLIFGGAATATVGSLMAAVSLGLLVWFTLPAGIALLSVVAQRSMVFAPSKLKPKASRLNPVSNAKNKYGPSGLFEFAKSFAKLVLYSALLGIYLKWRLPEMSGTLHAEPRGIGALMAQTIIEFMMVVCAIALSIGAVDYLWQHFDHMRRNRMSHREVRDEHKQNEGDPHMKQERRARGMQFAAEQMMADVPQADVVVVNPTHYAVALKWSRMPGAAPECVAKGVDHMALAIRELAVTHGVPVRHDPPTARALYATTEIGQEIDADQYRAVAAAIRFAETMRRRAGARK
ncbi:EscU/YscU/HrcU family type III secretion system export apparatus switch protein [Roseovarius pelagicus]|uniref:Flagellar type III secretion system protein FlhB n=1 Tax=Roseovarius pelagicus TaxID=2980108 RepID=A0ABY6D8L5_9RHOB|nr:flagellar type III secretion system protein FlhB [Roseovarius pelagicus]UXX82279.1 flagellar type III secretion system protein FlhB [Roseovarius pelagicus]